MPRRSASWMMNSAARSFTDWPGFMNSALPRIAQPVASERGAAGSAACCRWRRGNRGRWSDGGALGCRMVWALGPGRQGGGRLGVLSCGREPSADPWSLHFPRGRACPRTESGVGGARRWRLASRQCRPPMLRIASRHASSQRRQAAAQTRQCSCSRAWRSHSSLHRRHAIAQSRACAGSPPRSTRCAATRSRPWRRRRRRSRGRAGCIG